MVAGAAALIRAEHPEWNALQDKEQLRVSSDDINDIGTNSDFQYKFGKGRLFTDFTTRNFFKYNQFALGYRLDF
jgi:hypothetical protein